MLLVFKCYFSCQQFADEQNNQLLIAINNYKISCWMFFWIQTFSNIAHNNKNAAYNNKCFLNSTAMIVNFHVNVHVILLLFLNEYRHRHIDIITIDCRVVDRNLNKKHREKIVYFFFTHIAMFIVVNDFFNQSFEFSNMFVITSCYDAQHV